MDATAQRFVNKSIDMVWDVIRKRWEGRRNSLESNKSVSIVVQKEDWEYIIYETNRLVVDRAVWRQRAQYAEAASVHYQQEVIRLNYLLSLKLPLPKK